MSESNITLEQVEVLAATLEAEQAGRRERLLRLIKAEARIVAVRNPEQFTTRALEYGDEDGHWDNSYPPKMEYKNHNGPRLIKVHAADWDQVATSGRFYHDWKAVPSDFGLYVARDGSIWGCEYSGTGHYSQYAAHPGSDNVQLELDWSKRDIDDITDGDLMMIEEELRGLAFPLATERAGSEQQPVAAQ